VIWRIAAALIALALVYAAATAGWRMLTHPRPSVVVSPSRVERPVDSVPVIPRSPAADLDQDVRISAPAVLSPTGCPSAPAFADAARSNADSLQYAAWDVFGRAEIGWAIYEPLIAQEIATACPAQNEGFAQALAQWQRSHALPSSGVLDPPTLKALNVLWLRRRPFLAASGHGVCPPAPSPDRLVWAAKDEGYSGKPIQLRPAALAAYRAMVAALRDEAPGAVADKRVLTIFSGYRDPVSDAANCARDGNCGTIAKAHCSAHRTGLAMDIYLGAAPGYPPESSADPNRLYQSRTPTYRWLVANAARFGFTPYPFEPWHWEWIGEAP
jgi:D-alanyl-D-alanine carboxypeptidase